MAHRQIRAVFFDVGYTLVDETRLWQIWADCLGVPRSAFFAALDGVIGRREHHRRVFEVVQPGSDYEIARRQRESGDWPPDVLAPDDLYPDALPCLAELKSRGYLLGLAGNQPLIAEAVLATLGAPVDIIATSERWRVEKPSPAFFSRIVEEAGVPADTIAYVGDRLDNDVLPAIEAGMVGVFIRRGPWGAIHATWPDVTRAHLRIDSLAELPERLSALAVGT